VGISKNFERRTAEHLRQRGLFIRQVDGLENLSRKDARAVEQVLIEYYGLGKNGGSLLNKINSISHKNPVYAASVRRGRDLLKSSNVLDF
jgi:filamentous hemagglutinin